MINRQEIKTRVNDIFVILTGNDPKDIKDDAVLRTDLAMGDESIADLIDGLNINLGTHIIANVRVITTMAHLYALVEHELSETE